MVYGEEETDITAYMNHVTVNIMWNFGSSSLKTILRCEQRGLLSNLHGIQAQNDETDITAF